MVWGIASNSLVLGEEYDIRNTAIAQLDLIGCRQLAEIIKPLRYFFPDNYPYLSIICLFFFLVSWCNLERI